MKSAALSITANSIANPGPTNRSITHTRPISFQYRRPIRHIGQIHDRTIANTPPIHRSHSNLRPKTRRRQSSKNPPILVHSAHQPPAQSVTRPSRTPIQIVHRVNPVSIQCQSHVNRRTSRNLTGNKCAKGTDRSVSTEGESDNQFLIRRHSIRLSQINSLIHWQSKTNLPIQCPS